MSFILGLTGSIGMGKTTTASLFRAKGVPVHDADAAVHRLYSGAAVPLMEQAFPGSTRDGQVDRTWLARHVVNDDKAMRRLEAIVHPLVLKCENRFLDKARATRVPLVVLDVPLLFETGGAARCDAVCVVTVHPDVQKSRVMSRPEMTSGKFAAILARQLPDPQKRARAHFIVDTGSGIKAARLEIEAVLRALAGSQGRAMAERVQPHAA